MELAMAQNQRMEKEVYLKLKMVKERENIKTMAENVMICWSCPEIGKKCRECQIALENKLIAKRLLKIFREVDYAD